MQEAQELADMSSAQEAIQSEQSELIAPLLQ